LIGTNFRDKRQNMFKILILAGSLSFNHAPVPGQEIVLLNPEMNKIIEIRKSDSAGNFSFKIPSKYENEKLKAVIRFKKDTIVSAYYREVLIDKKNNSLVFDLAEKDFVTLRVNFNGPKKPAKLNFFIDPVSFEGMPFLAINYLTTDEKTATSYYFNVCTDKNFMTLKVRRGEYKLGAGFEYDAPSAKYKNSIAKKAVMNGTELKGDGIVGFKFDARQDAVIDLAIDETDE